MIARSVVCDPQILLLDEMTASLDKETEAKVPKAIGEKVWYFFQTKYKFVYSFGVKGRKTIELEYSAHLTQEALKVTMELKEITE